MIDLRRLSDAAPEVTLGDLLATVEARGHGPIILTFAGFMMLPTGALPMMPTVIGGFFLVIAFQMLVGGKGVSLPRRLQRIRFASDRLAGALNRAEPFCARLTPWLHPRWPGWVHGNLSLIGIALVMVLVALIMILIGIIPGLPFVLCLPVLLFGLGLTTGDGRVVAMGYLSCLGAAALVIRYLPKALSMLPWL